MLSLHNVTSLTKTIIKWVIIALVAILLFIFIIRLGIAVKNFLFPSPPAPPTVRFGKLPALPFKESKTNVALSYSLNTITGDLPVLPDRASVFIISHPRPSLLDLNRAREKASKIGFKGKESKVFDNIYEWKATSDLATNFILNIVTNDFTLKSPFMTNQNVLSSSFLPNEKEAVSLSLDFLNQLDLSTSDLNQDATKTELFAIRNSTLTPASSLSNTQVIRVDFYQNAVEKLPIFYSNPPNSHINFLIASGARGPVIVEANYFHQAISDISSTYPIKTAQQAYQELQNGKAYIASFLGADISVAITDILLGYYLTDEIQKYLMPIIIFKGDNGFFAYVSAVSDEHIIK